MKLLRANRIKVDRLNKIIKFLKTLGNEQLNMKIVVSESNKGCGTVCCLAGWAPAIFPEEFKWVDWTENKETVRELLVESVKISGRYISSIGTIDFHLIIKDMFGIIDYPEHLRDKNNDRETIEDYAFIFTGNVPPFLINAFKKKFKTEGLAISNPEQLIFVLTEMAIKWFDVKREEIES